MGNTALFPEKEFVMISTVSLTFFFSLMEHSSKNDRQAMGYSDGYLAKVLKMNETTMSL